ncbi:hypothetical protein [Kitasatospora sp. NPDC087315]|uniref:DUF7617 domain-containing protein n=1 Tax=Kitasatospora sp. NPDC087315 TaxID=3364069 RepID=UPI0038083929
MRAFALLVALWGVVRLAAGRTASRARRGPGRPPRAARAVLTVLVATAAAVSSFSLPASLASFAPPSANAANGSKAPAPPAPSRAAVPPLSKTGVDLTNGSTTTADHGDTLQWVVSYSNPASTVQPATVTDVIQGGPGSTPQTQTYVPGSLKVPPGFTPQWSTDGGTTFQTTDQGTATNVVQATNPNTGSPATSTTNLIPAPFTPVDTATGGDGFIPILFTATVNGQPVREAWNIYHHAGTSPLPIVVCTDLDTNGPCPSPTGAPQTWPRPLNSSAAGATTGDVRTTRKEQYVLLGDQLYYPASLTSTPTQIGVGCLNLQTQQSCGFTSLQSATAAGGNGIGGLVQAANGLIYGVSTSGQVLCYDPTTNTGCGTFSIGLGPNTSATNSPTPNDYFGTTDLVNGKIYITDTANIGGVNTSQMSCFDPATNAACTGWAVPKTLAVETGVPNFTVVNDNIFTDYDAAGNILGVCTTVGADSTASSNPAQGTVQCFSLTGASIAVPPGLQALVGAHAAPLGQNVYMNPLTITAPNGHLETEFPYWSSTPTVADYNYCYDWVTQAPCASYGTGGTLSGPPNVNGGVTRPYGYAYDGQCKYGLGDSGYLWSMDPVTGAAPCLRLTAVSMLNPAQFYCDGKTGHVTSYGTVSLADIDPTTVNFAASSVTVKDSSGNVLGTFPFNPTTGTADISSIPVSTSPITVDSNISLLNGSSFTPTNHPMTVVSFVGDPPQVCFDTTVGTDCSITSVSNQATSVTGTLPAVTSNTVTFQVTPGAGCQPAMTVLKEVCTSSNPADCQSGGIGPWASSASVPSGGTAYWRITATNTGQVNLTGITLNDGVAPSCVTAAGTFSLAAGASTQFYCSSPGITASTTNVVTATFPPPGGGQPITTPPSSATADVPSMTVLKEVCLSASAADCGQGGVGPWGPVTDVPSGGTAYWRITATNTDGVAITGITLNDTVAPSCVTAAGTFSLAAGASMQFFCSSANITASTTNVVTASFVPPGSPPGTPPVTTPPSSATANVSSLTIDKEVCGSTTVADCQSGGVGPWVKVTDVPSGGTAYWRIAVTNTDGTAISGATLTDTVAPSCVSAAGTFTVPAGQTVFFYCSSANITQTTTNTVTATYVPPGGTIPVTTSPSSATANVSTLTVLKEVCLSASAADCGQGGVGPWGPVTSVPSGGTAYWRITVTNTDGTAISGATLTDTVAPSCVSAAGTFTVPAGQTVFFYCSSANITQSTTNVVTANYVPPGSPPGTPPTTTPPSQATANVPSMTVLKEVCLSASAADCGQGGVGPWGPSTSVPSGGTAYWRITVTNTDGVDIPGVTLNDSVAPSCVTAAGSFDLPAAATKRFFCSTTNITQSTTNVVTASFVPPGSPPGTPPTTTPPSQATANVPSLTVLKEVCLSGNGTNCQPGGPGPWGN